MRLRNSRVTFILVIVAHAILFGSAVYWRARQLERLSVWLALTDPDNALTELRNCNARGLPDSFFIGRYINNS